MSPVSKNQNMENYSILAIFVAATIGFFFYMNSYHSTDVVYLASFMYDIPMLEKYFSNQLEIFDMFSRFGEHGMLGYNLLLLINAKYFHFTTYFDFLLNFVNIVIQCAILIYYVKKNIKKTNYYYFGLFIILLCMLNIMQGTSISMESQVRIGPTFFLLGAIYFDKLMFGDYLKKIDLLIFIILNIFAINIFGTLYTFAIIPAPLIILIHHLIFKKDKNIKYIKLLLVYFILPCIYLYEYKLLNTSDNIKLISNNSIGNGLLFWLSHPQDLALSILAFYGSSLLGWAPLVDKVFISINTYLCIGFLIVIIHAYAIYLFFKNQIYKAGFFPILLQSYTFFVFIMIIIGRWNSGDPQWMWPASYWYQFHTKFSLVGSILIFMRSYENIGNITKFKRVLIVVLSILIFIALIIGSLSAFIRAPSERAWRENIANYFIIDINEMPQINGLTPFLVNKELTEKGLKILRENNLMVFNKTRFDSSEFPAQISPGDLMLLGSYYADGWITKKIKFNINSGLQGKLFARFFIPNEAFYPNTISIFVDNKFYKEYEVGGSGYMDIYLEMPINKNSIIDICLKKSIIPSAVGMGEDSRDIAIMLTNFRAM